MSTTTGAKFYITTAIDYANGAPHLGHAFEKIGADAIARFQRLAGRDVHFLIGMDEHGLKVLQTAAEQGVEPQALVDEMAATFQQMWTRLGISNDQFMRTTEAGHKAGVVALIERIAARAPEAFYEKSYAGYYCVGCEAFKTDAEIVDGKCVLHPTRTLDWVEERNWFFRLSSYADFLRAHITANPEFVRPDSRRNEILALIDGGLEDISASRARLPWGVPFPLESASGERQTTYVWFDALPNYLTATGFPAAGFELRWPATLHVIGKDITRFHCVYWPALLHAAGLPLPEQVWGHGFVSLGGERFSKSAGVKLDLGDAISRFGADAFRYFLLREVPFDGDGNFSWERFEDRYAADLANAWGNLASRVIAMVERYFDGVVPEAPHGDVDALDATDIADYRTAMDGTRGYLLHEALRSLWLTVARGNEYVDRQAPWKLAKSPDGRAALETTIGTLMRQLARQAVCASPFMPIKAQELWVQLGGPGRVEDQRLDRLTTLDAAGWRVSKGQPLFPKDAPAPR